MASNIPLSKSERSLRGKLAAHAMHARYDTLVVSAPGRQRANWDRFVDQVDPDRVLAEEERGRRAEHARRSYFLGLALQGRRARGAQAQARKAQGNKQPRQSMEPDDDVR